MHASRSYFHLRDGSVVIEGTAIEEITNTWLDKISTCLNYQTQSDMLPKPYVTIIQEEELLNIDSQILDSVYTLNTSNAVDVYDLGVGTIGDLSWFVVLFIPDASALRESLNLKSGHRFFIPLKFQPPVGSQCGRKQAIIRTFGVCQLQSLTNKLEILENNSDRSSSLIDEEIEVLAYLHNVMECVTSDSREIIFKLFISFCDRCLNRMASNSTNKQESLLFLIESTVTRIFQMGCFISASEILLRTFRALSFNPILLRGFQDRISSKLNQSAPLHLRRSLSSIFKDSTLLRQLSHLLSSLNDELCESQALYVNTEANKKLAADKRNLLKKKANAVNSNLSINVGNSSINSSNKREKALGPDLLHNVINYFDLPDRFGWGALKGLLAGSAIPSRPEQLNALFGVGIRHVVTLLESPLSLEMQSHAEVLGLHCHFFAVQDRRPPTEEQVRAMLQLLHIAASRNEAILVHCRGGARNAATVMLALQMQFQRVHMNGEERGMILTEKIEKREEDSIQSLEGAVHQLASRRKVALDESQIGFLKFWWEVCVGKLPVGEEEEEDEVDRKEEMNEETFKRVSEG
mmetsp:Transcript_21986/g.31581  ORF Transcript_21986/g.31581 Transcript_21986/m.31581 type:complete len:578 (-) Transcript_21986:88-1821(-)